MRRGASELLPWADPYIARLIRKLQDEVRQERASRPSAVGRGLLARELACEAVRGEAPPPLSGSPIEFEVPRDQDWPLLRDADGDDFDIA